MPDALVAKTLLWLIDTPSVKDRAVPGVRSNFTFPLDRGCIVVMEITVRYLVAWQPMKQCDT